MSDDKRKELLKKLQALADRGVGGEKDAAKAKLDRLIKKYGIDMAELDDDREEPHEFHYHTKHEKKLIIQLFYKIVPDWSNKVFTFSYGKGSKTTIGIYCTKAQAIQIGVEYDFYRQLWEEELDFFLNCFIQKHSIFSMDPKDAKESTMSRAERLRMASIINGLQDKTMTARLPDAAGGDRDD